MRSAIILLPVALIVGCSGQTEQSRFRDRQLDYQAAYIEPKLRIPGELSDKNVKELLRIPGEDQPKAGLYVGSFDAPRAEVAVRNINLATLRRYQIGDMHWLSVPEAPSIVWPELERFIRENKLLVNKIKNDGKFQSITTNSFRGINQHSGSRIIRHFEPRLGRVAIQLILKPGLRPLTSEIKLTSSIGKDFDVLLTGNVLDELKYHLGRRKNEGKAVSRALSLVEVNSRMKSRTTVEGIDELVIDANIPRVMAVVVDTIKNLGGAVEGVDLERGLLDISYVRKSTERRLQTMGLINKAIATTIENPVGNYQIQMTTTNGQLILKAVPISPAASVVGANELIQEFLERLY